MKTLDGRGYLKATFDAEGTEIIATGLRLADSGDLDEPSAQRQGQALIDVFRFYLDHQNDKLGKRHRPHLNVVVNHDDLQGTRSRAGPWVVCRSPVRRSARSAVTPTSIG